MAVTVWSKCKASSPDLALVIEQVVTHIPKIPNEEDISLHAPGDRRREQTCGKR